MGEVTFLDYNKISDRIMWFDSRVSLNFIVNLQRKKKDGTMGSFHNEYKYYNEDEGSYGISLKRTVDCYFLIDVYNDFQNNIVIRAKDMYMLRYFFENNIMPWFNGTASQRAYKFDNNGKLLLKNKPAVQFPLSESKFLAFKPSVIKYIDDSEKEGITMFINSMDSYIEFDINKFLEFYYYITSIDMYGAAISLLNYVKMSPYGINQSNLGSFGDGGKVQHNRNNNSTYKGGGFFK